MLGSQIIYTIIFIIFLSYIVIKSCKLSGNNFYVNKEKHSSLKFKIILLTFLFYKILFYFMYYYTMHDSPRLFLYQSIDIFTIEVSIAQILILFLSLLIYCLTKIIAIKLVGWDIADIRLLPISLRVKYLDKNSNKKVIKFEHSNDLLGNVAAVSCYPKTVKDFSKRKILIINLSGGLSLMLIGLILLFNVFFAITARIFIILGIYFVLLGLVKLLPSKLSLTDGNALISLLNEEKFEQYKVKYFYNWYQHYPRIAISNSDFNYLQSIFENKQSTMDKFVAKYLLADYTIQSNQEKFKTYFADCQTMSATIDYPDITPDEASRLFAIRMNLKKLETEYQEHYGQKIS